MVLAGIGALLYFFVFSDDDEAGDYCGLLEDNVSIFSDLTTGDTDPAEAEQIVDTIHELREAAPGDIEDEWATIDDPFQTLDQALDDAGITWEEADEMQAGEFPVEVEEAAQEMANSLQEIDLSAIGQSIEDHAVDECGMDPSDFNSGQQ